MNITDAVRSSSRFNTTTRCSRCAGKGVLEAYLHVMGGMCLRCKGTGSTMTAAAKRAAVTRTRAAVVAEWRAEVVTLEVAVLAARDEWTRRSAERELEHARAVLASIMTGS